MKKLMICLFLVILLSSFVCAADFPVAKDKYLNDFAGIFTAAQVGELRGLLMAVEQNTTAEYVIVTVEQCAPYAPSDYAIKLLNDWKVGKADKNNGLVALYCKAENKIFVATGYGLEGILPDSKIGRFLDENYVPLRDSGDVSDGIIQFSRVIVEEMMANAEEIRSGQAGASSSWNLDIIEIIIIVLFLRWLIGIILSKVAKKKGNEKRFRTGFWPLIIPFGNSGGGGGFGGGFSGGFGGGGGGGGGAGR